MYTLRELTPEQRNSVEPYPLNIATLELGGIHLFFFV